MACRITVECISCGICLGRCANNAVYVTADDRFAIDPGRCTECVDLPHRRCEDICTVGAIQPDPRYRETAQQRWKKQRALHVVPIERILGY
ncbi:MAG: 4Fe-4S ferredoxin [Chloroflexi bacterium]|nr:4Fe-4S ferredoxin [Chloroflexota bacterium]